MTALPRVLLAAALALGATGAAAAWVSIGESESTAYYLDPDSVRSEGAHRRVWRLFEYKGQQREGVKSGKALIDIDCQAGTYRYLKTMYYSDAMGSGKYLGGRGEHRREHIAPGTMIGQLASMVCQPAGKK
ncbi:surface-adhesin E family protein [Ramlibacter sp. AN1133]|uniref:surface-adhesin E family protein n=1 Tax=Ramlibacter sp. AN1133 TaxID=3133429 RepID=UPI0030BC734D